MLVTGGKNLAGKGYRYATTLLRVSGKAFLASPEELQREAFGNEVMVLVAADEAELLQVLEHLEGQLTATVYSAASGADDALYARLEPVLRRKLGRLLNDKMPTGVAVSPAMNHGGPYPATGHPGFTAVGMPTSIARFTVLQCYDNVREERLPAFLRGSDRFSDGEANQESNGFGPLRRCCFAARLEQPLKTDHEHGACDAGRVGEPEGGPARSEWARVVPVVRAGGSAGALHLLFGLLRA